MIDSKHVNKIVVVFMVAAVIFTSFLMLYPDRFSAPAAEPQYVDKVFDKDKVTQIDIKIEQKDFDWLIENATREEYRGADITVNGETFYNVGIRPKGNSSLRTVAGDDTTDRFSFKLEFDTYVDGQTCFGLNKLVLNNMHMDKTYMKEYLAYDVFASMGVVTPLYSFANITVNGEPWGLYLAVEAMEESFAERNFGSTYGNLYKPEGAGADLKWAGESASNYSGIRNGAAYKVTDSDFDKVIEMIEHLNSGTDLEKYLDVDAILRYFAVNTVLVNFDSYACNMKHNYYLYEEGGMFTILPWDLNLAFAGFGIGSGEQAVNYPIDKPVTTDLSERPLIGKLLEVPEYKELYYKYLSEIVANYFDSGQFEQNIQKVDKLINSYVKNDATAFFTYEQYHNALPVLLEFGKQRAASITGQLAGERSSTTWEQSEPTSGSGNAASVDLSAINGEMRGDMGGPGGPGGNRRQGNAGQVDNRDLPVVDTGQQVAGDRMEVNDGEAAGGVERGNDRAGGGGPLPPEQGAGPPAFNNAGGGNWGGDMLNRENMSKAMEIIQGANGQELTDEQMTQLKELGLDEAMIERMKNMPERMGPPGDGGFGGGFGDQNMGFRLTTVQKEYISASAALLLAGLLFVAKFNRRKYSS
ncbi:CotH kinase family protein [Desulfoscipio gibsoniae]|uniref:CotH protein n=1 Tax=Desulfoscipio gibsoniae DSM 7213 TaxID=767817 RepID=R4KJ49_9FIRM|nr:CotH kinase family protein [Desulfoscipio gibsoniae]AGL00520.1 CotH protein [Desulfoscipio gibsoniae DSM 7213]